MVKERGPSLGFTTDEEREPIPGVHDQRREGAHPEVHDRQGEGESFLGFMIWIRRGPSLVAAALLT